MLNLVMTTSDLLFIAFAKLFLTCLFFLTDRMAERRLAAIALRTATPSAGASRPGVPLVVTPIAQQREEPRVMGPEESDPIEPSRRSKRRRPHGKEPVDLVDVEETLDDIEVESTNEEFLWAQEGVPAHVKSVILTPQDRQALSQMDAEKLAKSLASVNEWGLKMASMASYFEEQAPYLAELPNLTAKLENLQIDNNKLGSSVENLAKDNNLLSEKLKTSEENTTSLQKELEDLRAENTAKEEKLRAEAEAEKKSKEAALVDAAFWKDESLSATLETFNTAVDMAKFLHPEVDFSEMKVTRYLKDGRLFEFIEGQSYPVDLPQLSTRDT